MPRPIEKKLYKRYDSIEERIVAWRENRKAYDEWRHTPDGEQWVGRRRKQQLNKCFICLTTLRDPMHVDHIFPLYLGGTNSLTNLCVVHADCNIRKGVRVYMTYKQACKRRNHFNRLQNAIKTRRKLSRQPELKVSKKQLKNLKYLNKFLSEEEIGTFL